MTPLQKEILLHFMPPWSRRVAVSDRIGAAHISLPEFPPEIQSLEACGALSLDAMYVAGIDAPRNPRAAVPLFSKLDGGGVAILESRAGGSVKRALNDVARGNGLRLIFFGAPESVKVDPADRDQRNTKRLSKARRGRASGTEHIAVFQKPALAGYESEGRRLSITAGAVDVEHAFVRDRLLAWRDFISGARLSNACELLLVSDDPERDEALQDFIKAELRDLRRDGALSVVRHYRRFGAARALQSAARFAKGGYAFWEDLAPEHSSADAMSCQDLFACLGEMWRLEDRRGGLPPYRSCTILPRPIRSHAKSGQRLKSKSALPSALWNQSALRSIADAGTSAIERRLLRSRSAVFAGAQAACVVRAVAMNPLQPQTSAPQLPGPAR
ncbi:MAG: hypothetical protein NXI24_02990 [bacterium]|nr:hypothetical protein [bacterium]